MTLKIAVCILVFAVSCGKETKEVQISNAGALHISGSVTGFPSVDTTQTLGIQLNGSETLQLNENGDFQFLTGLTKGDSIEIKIVNQPKFLQCTILQQNLASGKITSDIDILKIECKDIIAGTWLCGAQKNCRMNIASDGPIWLDPTDSCSINVAMIGDGKTWKRISDYKVWISIPAQYAIFDDSYQTLIYYTLAIGVPTIETRCERSAL